MGRAETNIGNQICVALSKLGCKIFRSQVGTFYTQNGDIIKIGIEGHSDYYGVRPDGKAFFIETKTATGRKRDKQILFIDVMKKCNALAGFARSVDDAMKIVTEDGYEFQTNKRKGIPKHRY